MGERATIDQDYLYDIADAIRAKNGSSDTYTPEQMASAIGNIHPGADVEPLSVTENGAYTAPTGKAYSPVTVSVSGGGVPDRTKTNNLLVDCYTRQGWIGGFYSSNAVMQPQDSNYNALDVDWASAFKMHLKIKLINTKTGSQALYGPYQSNTYQKTPTCEIQGTSKFWFGFTTNGSSWTDMVDITEIPIVQNGIYEITINSDGSKIDITVTDGSNVATRTITPSGALYHSSSYKIGFGNIAKNSTLYSNYVYFDPDNSYIESNGTLVWGARPS